MVCSNSPDSEPVRRLRQLAGMAAIVIALFLCGWYFARAGRTNVAFGATKGAADNAPAADQTLVRFGRAVKGSINPGETRAWATPSLAAGSYYSVDVSLDSPSSLTTPDELIPRKIASSITFNVVKEDIVQPVAR